MHLYLFTKIELLYNPEQQSLNHKIINHYKKKIEKKNIIVYNQHNEMNNFNSNNWNEISETDNPKMALYQQI